MQRNSGSINKQYIGDGDKWRLWGMGIKIIYTRKLWRVRDTRTGSDTRKRKVESMKEHRVRNIGRIRCEV